MRIRIWLLALIMGVLTWSCQSGTDGQDSGIQDAHDADSGEEDAGYDAGEDAGQDAGNDAGLDAGGDDTEQDAGGDDGGPGPDGTDEDVQPCDGVECPEHEHCEAPGGTPECVCDDGYIRENENCVLPCDLPLPEDVEPDPGAGVPFGFLDVPAFDSQVPRVGRFRGWVLSAQAIEEVSLTIDGENPVALPLDVDRPAVCNAFPDLPCDTAGFSVEIDLSGYSLCDHIIEVTARTVAGGETVIDRARVRLIPPDIFDPQREEFFSAGTVTISGNRFYVGDVEYFPKTDFLTAVPPGTDILSYTTHCYLPQGANRKQTIRNALINSGYNSIYVYTLNQGDYHASGDHPENVVTPYGTGGWSFDTNQLNQTRIDAWKAEIHSLIHDHHLKPFIWLRADDSSAINNASLDKWNTYVDHMVAAFEEYPIVWVLGLEVDEYWSSAQVSDRRAYLQSQTQHPVGVHLTINETRNVNSGYKTGFDFIMVQFDSPQSDSEYVNDSNQYILLDRPYIAAEFNVSGTGGESSVTARSKAIGTVIGGVGSPSRASGIGNGVNVRN